MTDTEQTDYASIADEIDAKNAAVDAAAAEVLAEEPTDAPRQTIGVPVDPDAGSTPDPTPKVDTAPAPRLPGKVKSGADRRPRGWLETDVKAICDAFVTGEIAVEDGKFMTPHRLSVLVQERDSLEEAPSTGACAAVLARWADLGFAVLNDKPVAFLDYTEEGRTKGLTAMKAEKVDARKTERAAVKDAEKAAKQAEKEAAKAAAASTAS